MTDGGKETDKKKRLNNKKSGQGKEGEKIYMSRRMGGGLAWGIDGSCNTNHTIEINLNSGEKERERKMERRKENPREEKRRKQ